MGKMAKVAVVAAGAAGIGALAIGIDKSVKAALDAEVAQKKLGAAFTASHLSVKKYWPEVEKAEAAGRRLGFVNTDTEAGLAKLVVATGNTGKAVKDLGVAQDIARFKGTDLTTASQMLAMAMTGSQRAAKQLGITVIPLTTNMDALKKSHMDLTTAAGKAAEAAAKLADKQATGAAVIAKVSEKLRGQAKAYADTAAGGMAKFRAGLNNIEEQVGKHLLPVLGSIANAAADGVSGATKWFGKLDKEVSKQRTFTGKLRVIWTNLQQVAQDLASRLADFFWRGWTTQVSIKGGTQTLTTVHAGLLAGLKTVDWGAIGKAILDGIVAGLKETGKIAARLSAIVSAAVDKIPWGDIGVKMGPALAGAIAAAFATLTDPGFWAQHWSLALAVAVTAFPVGRLGGLAAKLGGELALVVAGVIEKFSPALAKGFLEAITFAVAVLAKLGPMAAAVLERVGAFLEGVIKGIFGKLGRIAFFVVRVLGIQAVINALENLAVAAYNKAKQIGTNIVQGIYGVVKTVGKWVKGALDAIWAVISGVAHSAYTAATAIGAEIIHGIIAGMGDLAGRVGGWIHSQLAGAVSWAGSLLHGSGPFQWTKHTIGIPMMQGIIEGIVATTSGVATTLANSVTVIIQGAIIAAKQALAKAKTDLVSTLSSFASAAVGGFDAAGGGTATTRRLAAKAKREAAAIAAQQIVDQRAANEKAIKVAKTKLGDDTSAGADAATLTADQDAIDAAIKAKADYEAQQQAQADADKAAKKQKDDKDAFEKALAALEQQAAGAKTEAQVKAIQEKIRALFKKYGLTFGSVEAGSDWNTAQTLFVGAMGDLNRSMQALIIAINNLTGASSALPSTSAGSLPHHADGGKTKAGLAMLHAGEYVLKSSATRKIGLPALNHLNWFGHFQEGGFVPNLPKIGKNPKINPTTGGPDDPAYRAAAMYLNDYGDDRNQVDIGTALAGLLGPRAQAQAAIRATRVGGVSLRHGLWRAGGGVVDSKMVDAWKKNYPGITFEPGTPGQQISWMQAASRLPQGGQELGSLIASSMGGSGTGANTHGSLVEQLTSHAVHFARGGTALADGLAMLHKNETVIPARGGMPIQLHTTIELDGRVVGRSVQNYLGEQARWGSPGLAR
jgi:phage-related protein